mmetsp:Transcript_27082/g.80877  ORF Transcript_27082/g.80877 Transcript_27082/m.80877 type:complete len:434 (-) Transcript_27082:720-2021(-)
MAQLARPHRLNVKCVGRAAHRGRVRCGRGGAAIVVAVVLGLFDEFHCVQIDLALLEDFVEHHRHQAHRDALAGALARGRVPAAVGPVEEDVIFLFPRDVKRVRLMPELWVHGGGEVVGHHDRPARQRHLSPVQERALEPAVVNHLVRACDRRAVDAQRLEHVPDLVGVVELALVVDVELVALWLAAGGAGGQRHHRRVRPLDELAEERAEPRLGTREVDDEGAGDGVEERVHLWLRHRWHLADLAATAAKPWRTAAAVAARGAVDPAAIAVAAVGEEGAEAARYSRGILPNPIDPFHLVGHLRPIDPSPQRLILRHIRVAVHEEEVLEQEHALAEDGAKRGRAGGRREDVGGGNTGQSRAHLPAARHLAELLDATHRKVLFLDVKHDVHEQLECDRADLVKGVVLEPRLGPFVRNPPRLRQISFTPGQPVGCL